jgi:hypothetical protein
LREIQSDRRVGAIRKLGPWWKCLPWKDTVKQYKLGDVTRGRKPEWQNKMFSERQNTSLSLPQVTKLHQTHPSDVMAICEPPLVARWRSDKTCCPSITGVQGSTGGLGTQIRLCQSQSAL